MCQYPVCIGYTTGLSSFYFLMTEAWQQQRIRELARVMPIWLISDLVGRSRQECASIVEVPL